ncbi:MAG: hypothetical protein RR942_12130 [Romboutsia sp.]
MEINEFIKVLKEWGTKDDIITGANCMDGCNECKLNNKILIGYEIDTICTIICKIRNELNTI